MKTHARFHIGTQYRTRGKHPRVCTVTDIHYTYNNVGELVAITYVTTQELMGQTITERNVCDTTIAMGLLSGSLSDYA